MYIERIKVSRSNIQGKYSLIVAYLLLSTDSVVHNWDHTVSCFTNPSLGYKYFLIQLKEICTEMQEVLEIMKKQYLANWKFDFSTFHEN